MAAIGATIVFLGLVILSFFISQIHKIFEFWEDRDKYLNRFKKEVQSVDEEKIETPVYRIPKIPTVNELASIYRPLVEQLKEPFELSQLHEISKKLDLPHPHLSIQCLREADILVNQGDGTFTWNKQRGY
jgi:hypothetical protein